MRKIFAAIALSVLVCGAALAAVAPLTTAPAGFDQPKADVAKGRLDTLSYVSKPLAAERRVIVYLPAGYDADPRRRYPVLYLKHGGGENETAWQVRGQAPTILDNLIASRKAVPMIVVMPNGTMPDRPGGPYGKEAIALATREMFEDIVPLVESKYRVKTGPENTAIAGLSMGGGQSFYMGINNQTKFSAIGVFSTGIFGGINIGPRPPGAPPSTTALPTPPAPFVAAVDAAPILSDPAAFNRRIKLFYLSSGDTDPRVVPTQEVVEMFQSKGVKVVATRQAGGHVWVVWRHALYDFAPRLFR